MITRFQKKRESGKCKKNMPIHEFLNAIHAKKILPCKMSRFFNSKRINDNWVCFTCVSNVMSVSSIDNNQLILDLQNISKLLLNSQPSFTIQYSIKCQGTDEFMSDTISSKYFTPSEFLENKLAE